MERILIADDDSAIRSMLRDFLEDEDYEIEETENGQDVLTAFKENSEPPDLVLMDVRMPDKSGMEVLREIGEGAENQLPIILMTAYGTSNVAIEAMQLGAYDYITKPFDLEDVLHNVRRFFDHQALLKQVHGMRSNATEHDPNDTMIGNSPSMQEVYKTIGRVARSESTVLITGETGTGKELVAAILHRSSSYSGGPMVKVNCAALPETLLESELFGHEKGAFTGAVNQRKGRFETANKGTIFLDEIGEMTLSTQKKLLRVLQEREFERVGGNVSVKVDTRVIAATNKNLAHEVREGRFREDLYYRLNVISLYLPPLRERTDDIPRLVEHFLHKHRYNPGAAPAKISPQALDLLMEHNWPGNVRELENIIERAVVLAQGTVIGEDHIRFSSADQRHFIDLADRVRKGTPMSEVRQEVERKMLIEAISQSSGDRVAASALLGIDLHELQQKLEEYGVPSDPEAVNA